MSGGKLSRPRARDRSGSAIDEPRVRPSWSSSSIDEPGQRSLDAALERRRVDQQAVGHEHGIGRLPGVGHGLPLDQGRRHVDRTAAALGGRHGHEARIVVDPVVAPGADGVVDHDHDRDQRQTPENPAPAPACPRRRLHGSLALVQGISSPASVLHRVTCRALPARGGRAAPACRGQAPRAADRTRRPRPCRAWCWMNSWVAASGMPRRRSA